MNDEEKGYLRGVLVGVFGLVTGMVLDRLVFGDWLFAVVWP